MKTNQPSQFILASGSPRRRELLSRMGLAFQIEPAEADEHPQTGEDASHLAPRLAALKAHAVARNHLSEPGRLVLAADTIVTFGGRLLGKPQDEAEAAQMLRWLSGRAHSVISGVSLLRIASSAGRCADNPGSSRAAETGNEQRLFDFERTISVETRVRFRPLSDAEIAWYVASGEPMDKAGAYAIQGIAGAFVEAIEGSHSNVIGLPLAETLALLSEAGVSMAWDS